MNKDYIGVKAEGIKLPIMRQGDDLVNTVVDCVLKATELTSVNKVLKDTIIYSNTEIYDIQDKSVIGITESLVGRCYGLYVTVDDIAIETEKFFGKDAEIWMTNAIYSRNRHSLILRGIARACKRINFVATPEDSRGNLWGVNPFTGVDIAEYYKQICNEEGCEFVVYNSEDLDNVEMPFEQKTIDCSLHTQKHHKDEKYPYYYYLTDYCNDKCPDFGLLGTNKANDENGGTLKLFPPKKLAENICNEVKAKIKKKTGKDVYVMIFGDSHFHSPYLYNENRYQIPGTSINEFADPVAFMSGVDTPIFESTPNEIKIKYFADDKFKDLNGEELNNAIKNEIKSVHNNLKGNMAQMGCTPRRIGDLLATNFDTLVGSGSKGCPVVLMQNYFNDFSTF